MIDKLIIIPFKKTQAGNHVYTYTPIESTETFLLNKPFLTTDYKAESIHMLNSIGFDLPNEKRIIIDLGILIYQKQYFKGLAFLIDNNPNKNKKPSFITNDKFLSIEKAIEICNSPFKEFLEKLTNWTVI